jgi:hypothetical protein
MLQGIELLLNLRDPGELRVKLPPNVLGKVAARRVKIALKLADGLAVFIERLGQLLEFRARDGLRFDSGTGIVVRLPARSSHRFLIKPHTAAERFSCQIAHGRRFAIETAMQERRKPPEHTCTGTS